MKPGPRPKSTAELRASGGYRHDRHAGRDTVRLPSGPIKPPDILRPDAVEVWNQLTGRLATPGLLAPADAHALARLANAYAKLLQCEAFLAEHGLTYSITDSEGETRYREYPESQIAARLSAEIDRIGARFGLTPSDRAALKIPPIDPRADAENPFSKFGGGQPDANDVIRGLLGGNPAK